MVPGYLFARYLNKLIALYRMIMVFMGYKSKSSVHGLLPALDYTECRKMCRDIVAARRPYVFNDANWGPGQESLEEFVISAADWDKRYGRRQ